MDYVSSRNSSSSGTQVRGETQTNSQQVQCESKKETLYDAFLDPYFKWIDLLAYAIIPFIIMLICTFLIVRVLFRSNRRLNKTTTSRTPHHLNNTTTTTLTTTTNNETNNKKGDQAAAAMTSSASRSLLNPGHGTTTTSSTIKSNKTVAASGTPAAVAASRASKAKHLTYTLIILNCLFFCLVGPLLIVLVTFTDQMIVDAKLLVNIVYSLAYANHTFNFVLYGVSSPPFRAELLRILRLSKSTTNTNANNANAAATQNENRTTKRNQ